MFFELKKGDTIIIAAGALEKPHGLNTMGHIFIADRSDYYEILDVLTKFKEYPGNLFCGWET